MFIVIMVCFGVNINVIKLIIIVWVVIIVGVKGSGNEMYDVIYNKVMYIDILVNFFVFILKFF